jgi:SHS2 domain-containing protein
MSKELTILDLPPEELELAKKLRVVDRLAERLANAEEDMADIRAELGRFEAHYSMQVGRLYAEQDEIDAQIAEEELKLVPDDEEIKKKVEELRRAAEESAARARAAEAKEAEKWEPTPEARKAYHEMARAIHPDLVVDAGEKQRRHDLMSQLNEAYSSGDRDRLQRLAADLRVSPEAVTGEGTGDRLVRAIRQIWQVKRRLKELADERTAIGSSELYALYQRSNAEAEAGRNMLEQMAERARTHISKSLRRLENLRNVNTAAEEYVKERFGMDIGDFR